MKRYPVVCTAEVYHGKGISSRKRARLRISIASDVAKNLRGPLGLRRLNLEAVGPSCGLLMPPTGPSGQRGPSKVAWEAYWSWVMGPWTPRGPQSDPLGALFIFCKPGIRVKAACRTKRGPSQNFRTLFLSFSDPFSCEVGSLMLLGALKHILGPLRSRMVPLSLIFFVIFVIFIFSCSWFWAPP